MKKVRFKLRDETELQCYQMSGWIQKRNKKKNPNHFGLVRKFLKSKKKEKYA